jgi:LPXTG-motif cell wall-anchored protein
MLRKIAAGTGAVVVVAAGLAAAPAAASGLPTAAGECTDTTPVEGAAVEAGAFEQSTSSGFVFGPLADVPHLHHSASRGCFTASHPAPGAAAPAPVAAPAVPDPAVPGPAFADPAVSSAHRRTSKPPADTPVPEVPPPADSGPGGPGPIDSGPPPPASPPSAPPAPPELPPIETPPPPAPTSTSAPQESGRQADNVLPAVQPPEQLPQTAAETRPLTIAGGGSLIAAGLAWMGGARRRNRRARHPRTG